MIIPKDHQITIYEEACKILDENKLVILYVEQRVGKTITSLMLAKYLGGLNINILTKKAAIRDWEESVRLSSFNGYNITVTNYHNAHKLDFCDVLILDESHNYITAVPKPSKTWLNIKRISKDIPIIYLSGTPCAQGNHQLYPQLQLSSYSPFKQYRKYSDWFKFYADWDNYKPIRGAGGMQITDWKCIKGNDVFNACKHLMVFATREGVGFKHEPEDELHYVKLKENTRKVYNQILKHRVLEFKDREDLICDTQIKLLHSLYMLEGGALKLGDTYLDLGSVDEKVNYIKDKWGDKESVAIMYNYIGEGVKLRKHFKNALVLQASTYSEGIDLHHIEDLIIYSQDFSTAKYIQRRARQCHFDRVTPIKVKFLVVEGGISEQVYKTVASNKANFTDKHFDEVLL